MKTSSFRRGALAGALAVGLLVSGCSAAPSEDGVSTDSAIVSGERVQLFAKDDATRVACRDVTNRTFCSMADATAQARACTGAATDAHLSAEVSQEPCSKSAEVYPTIASCDAPKKGQCGFYSACVERALPCGEDGYALGFGERFCTASRNADLSAKGRSWAVGVMDCLQRTLVPRVLAAGTFTDEPASPAVCSALFEEGFASHPTCYTHPDHSICSLPPGDLKAILDIIGVEEVFTRRTRVQVVQTIGVCIGQVTKKIARHLFGASWREGDASELPALHEREQLLRDLARAYEADEPLPPAR